MVDGYPGTGKTYIISVLLAILIWKEKWVLITCFSHKSLNIILQNLKELLNPHELKNVIRLVGSKDKTDDNDFDLFTFDKIQRYKDYT